LQKFVIRGIFLQTTKPTCFILGPPREIYILK
jgi:hypothetical protein